MRGCGIFDEKIKIKNRGMKGKGKCGGIMKGYTFPLILIIDKKGERKK